MTDAPWLTSRPSRTPAGRRSPSARTCACRCATASRSPPTPTTARTDKPRPALVALSPYGKELQALALTMPPQRRPSPMWDGCIEAGDIARVVAEDYVHVIGDLRGSGASEGEHIGNYNAGGVSLGQDAYDFIEWVAAQPWCDGNVGMIGISYFGSMQVLRRGRAAAAPQGDLRLRRPLRLLRDHLPRRRSCGSCRAPPARAAAATPAGRSPTASSPACSRPTPRRRSRSASPSGCRTRTWPPGRTSSTCCTTRRTTRPGSTS